MAERFVRANRHALASGEAIELQHRRVFPAMAATASSSVSVAVPRAVGNAVADEEILWQTPCSLQLRRFFRRPPARDAVLGAKIRETLALDEVALLAGHAEVDGVLPSSRRSARFQAVCAKSALRSRKSRRCRETEQLGISRRFRQARTSACSRPPLPTTSILIRKGSRESDGGLNPESSFLLSSEI